MPEEYDGTRVPDEADRQGVPLVGQVVEKTQVVVEKTSRFSREFVATMISLASAAFGVVAALAWNSAITSSFTRAFGGEVVKPTSTQIRALYIYAVVVTLIGVTVIVLLGRLATRINAEPVEFKYPGVPKSS
jgi:uncharacterized membrane protein YjjP (DUF1212 family)